MFRRLGPKRLALLLLGLGYLGLFVDAYIGHVAAGGGISAVPQYTPLLFAPLAFVVLVVTAVLSLSERALAGVTLVVGLLSSVIGLVGVGLHLVPVLQDLADEELNFASLTGALGVAPPLLAPGAFFAVGLLVTAIGRRRVRLSVDGWDGGGSGRTVPLDGRASDGDKSAHRAA